MTPEGQSEAPAPTPGVRPTTRAAYWDYKNRVEAKTTGAHNHEVCGLLGRILNTVANIEGNPNPPAEALERIATTTKEIAILTGVHP